MTQCKRKKVGIMKEKMIVEELVIKEVLEEPIDIIHLLTHPGILMHIKSQEMVQKCLILGIKEEDMSWTICKESLGSLSHQPLTMKTKGEMMLKPSFLESENISSCIATHLT